MVYRAEGDKLFRNFPYIGQLSFANSSRLYGISHAAFRVTWRVLCKCALFLGQNFTGIAVAILLAIDINVTPPSNDEDHLLADLVCYDAAGKCLLRLHQQS